ncbi:MAG TPA: hypothetical protein VIV61_04035 [Candidatus Ozemobacteraceae bacterium]
MSTTPQSRPERCGKWAADAQMAPSRIRHWNDRQWLVWLVLFLAALTARFTEGGLHAWRAVTIPFDAPSGRLEGLLFSPSGYGRLPGTVLLAAHGTNSHREIFLPLAWECSRRSVSLFAFDSPTVTTDEGVAIRRDELAAAARALTRRYPTASITSVLGHSDGVPPALEFAGAGEGKPFRALILGSFVTYVEEGERTTEAQRHRDFSFTTERAVATYAAFAGAFDQVFPVAEIRASLDELHQSEAPLTVSWLSDHFVEQYDPILISAALSAIIHAPVSPWLPALSLLLYVCILVLAFIGGTAAATESRAFRPLLAGGFLVLWAVGASVEWTKGPALAGLLGMVAGPLPVLRTVRPIVTFWGLMAANVAVASAWFRDHLTAGLLWFPVMAAWYLPAWLVKLALFSTSLARRADPLALPYVPSPVLALAAIAVLWPALPEMLRDCFTRRESAGTGDRSRTLAFILVAAMLLLWVIRFFQGFVRLEILASMAATYARTLLLPTLWLLQSAIRAVRPPSSGVS